MMIKSDWYPQALVNNSCSNIGVRGHYINNVSLSIAHTWLCEDILAGFGFHFWMGKDRKKWLYIIQSFR